MSDNPFEIRPVEIKEDFKVKPSLISEEIAVSADSFLRLCQEKDLAHIIHHRAKREKIILPADLFLSTSDAPRRHFEDRSKNLLPLAVIFGIILGFLVFIPFFADLPYSLFLVIALVLGLGLHLGWTSHQRLKERKEALINWLEIKFNYLKNAFLSE